MHRFYGLLSKIKRRLYVVKSLMVKSIFLECGKNVRFGKIGLINQPEFIKIGKNTKFGDYVYLTAWNLIQTKEPKLIIGENCNFGVMNHITCANKITIGNNVLTGKWVTISDNNHGDTNIKSLQTPPLSREIVSNGEIVIEDNVWVGDKVTILGNVRIGIGAVIAANSVVTKNVPAYSVVAGIPASIIKSND